MLEEQPSATSEILKALTATTVVQPGGIPEEAKPAGYAARQSAVKASAVVAPTGAPIAKDESWQKCSIHSTSDKLSATPYAISINAVGVMELVVISALFYKKRH